MIELNEIVAHLAQALMACDATKDAFRSFKPGIGPFGEPEATNLALMFLRKVLPEIYSCAGPRAYPGSKKQCDLVMPGEWAIEVKLIRPFGDNGKPAEHWSENILHPYPGNTSAIGDGLKLLESGFTERKGIVVYGFEHTPPQVALELAVRSFEVIARDVVGLRLGERISCTFEGLVHPFHQQGRIYGWELLPGTE